MRVSQATSLPLLLLGSFLLGTAVQSLETKAQGFLETVLRHEFNKALETGAAGPVLKEVSQKLDLANMLEETSSWETKSQNFDPLLCAFCSSAMAEIIQLFETGTDPLIIVDGLVNLCVDLGIANYPFCEGVISEVEPHLAWILENRNLTGKDVCGMVLVGFGCNTNNPERVWEVQIPDGPKPPVVDPVLPPEGSPTMKILHLADTHFDPEYLPGSNAECKEKYFCCRAESGPLDRPEAAAGKWGDYRNCDAPKWLLQATYDHIKMTHTDIDFIIWTGDLIPHNVWNTSRETNLEIIYESVQLVADNFPGIPVFPAIGNHEAHPVNTFPQPYIDNEFDISWLYDEIAILWGTWLPKDVAESVAYSAYYSTLIKPGLRILSINSNYCYGFNWWLLYDDVDPGTELDWMAKQLKAAEEAGEKVYLISHIPPGHRDCAKTWSHQYNRIVSRFESTIAGLFYGHTHKDHFMMFYDPVEATRAYHVGYIGPSQTPYHKVNPGYRIYTVDGDYEGSSYQVLDHETWILDLDEVNQSDDPRFFKLYSAKESYGLENLFPSTWSDLVTQMAVDNSTLFDEFFMHYIKDAKPYMEEGCGERCKSQLLCRLVVSDNSDHSHCEGL
ncbi:sphingomyelin phosphodiesterase-like isoform X2 [Palaemon carinicauda]|uniref:sphingomyelin phosphodiesterase-like isoform X2 n=1 Tax=Palaemon carinicauda TaxID=392227 RepID=UPI0035B57930